jgi:cell division protein FtsL
MTYSSSLAMNRNRYSGRNKNSISFSLTDRKIGPVSNTIILVVLACLLGLIYLTQVTKTNTYGYQIESLQSKQMQLENQKQNLEVSQAQLQSLSRVQNSSVAKSMVAVTPSGTVSR